MNKWVLPSIIVAVVIVVIAIIASVSPCPADAKLCPDGSYVARTGLNCEFAQCPESTGGNCAKEGEQFSVVYADQYPEKCCSGLTEWSSGIDTRVSVEGECFETGLLAGIPVGTCINCGNGICESIKNACNCPADCPEKSDYDTVEEYCASDDWDRIAVNCYPPYFEEPLPICDLCYLSIQPPCEEYTYSDCPEGCLKRCVPSECNDDEPPECTADCDGPESCLTYE